MPCTWAVILVVFPAPNSSDFGSSEREITPLFHREFSPNKINDQNSCSTHTPVKSTAKLWRTTTSVHMIARQTPPILTQTCNIEGLELGSGSASTPEQCSLLVSQTQKKYRKQI
jgi:hypothetical protein